MTMLCCLSLRQIGVLVAKRDGGVGTRDR